MTVALNLAAATELADAGKRLSDAVALALLADPVGNTGRWIAARLSDGGTDGVIYDRKIDAIRHQLHPTQCAYVCLDPMGMTPATASVYLAATRRLYAHHGGVMVTEADLRPGYRPGPA